MGDTSLMAEKNGLERQSLTRAGDTASGNTKQKRWSRRSKSEPEASVPWAATMVNRRVSRGQILIVVAMTTALWLVFESSWPMIPVKILATLIHEAGHALALEAMGGSVEWLVVNEHGGGVTSGRLDDPDSSVAQVVVASAGYLGTTTVGALLLEGAAHLRRGRIALLTLAGAVVALGLAWVPLRVDVDSFTAQATGSDSGDGRFTIFVCAAAVTVLIALAWQPSVRLRTGAVVALATAFCLAGVEDLRQVMDWSAQGGHSDAVAAAEATGLSSWMWAVIWLLVGAAACGLALWAALSRDVSSADRTLSARLPELPRR